MSSKLVARLSGIVTYSDGSHAQFAVHRDEQGNLSYNSKTASVDTLKQVDDSCNWLDTMLTLAGSRDSDASIAFSLASPSAAKTVTGLVAELSGRVSITPVVAGKKTWEDFIFQYDSNKSDAGTAFGATIPEGDVGLAVGDDRSTAWHKAGASFTAQLNAMFSGLGIVVS